MGSPLLVRNKTIFGVREKLLAVKQNLMYSKTYKSKKLDINYILKI